MSRNIQYRLEQMQMMVIVVTGMS